MLGQPVVGEQRRQRGLALEIRHGIEIGRHNKIGLRAGIGWGVGGRASSASGRGVAQRRLSDKRTGRSSGGGQCLEDGCGLAADGTAKEEPVLFR